MVLRKQLSQEENCVVRQFLKEDKEQDKVMTTNET